MILTDENLLRRTCEQVSINEADTIIGQLEAELVASADKGRPGIGLAAPQIGILKKVAIIRIDGIHSVNLVNARIIRMYDQFTFNDEGCLSFPEQYARTKRYNEICVENEIEPKRFIAKGLFAVCIQHELDHLEGRILPDYKL